VVQFSLRTLLRSSPHRLILAFYWGLGFGVAVIALKAPSAQQLAVTDGGDDWHTTAVPILASSLLLMVSAVIGARMAFAMPRDLRANWIFRLMPRRDTRHYLSARRRALVVSSALPVWVASAALVLLTWPWQPALAHLGVLAVVAAIAIELGLAGSQKLPFTCSYLPGKSRVHVAVYAGLVLLLPAAVYGARFEHAALQDFNRYVAILTVLGAVWGVARWRTWWLSTGTEPQFDDEPANEVVTLGVWDSRFAGETVRKPAR
jgi:hypothetical protein